MPLTGEKLTAEFYTNADVLSISKALLGKVLFTNIEGQVTGGIIVETEAYSHTEKACHAYNFKRTPRTEVMFMSGGTAYVYLCYGIHHLFNVVTNVAENPEAVLIRAVEPYYGTEQMLQRRNMPKQKSQLTAGPGSLSQALGITTRLNAQSLLEDQIWIADIGLEYADHDIIKSPRVGVSYAGADALLPWRFRVKGNPYTSPAK